MPVQSHPPFPRPGCSPTATGTNKHTPAIRYQRRTSARKHVDRHTLTCMCTPHADVHAWGEPAPLPAGTRRTPVAASNRAAIAAGAGSSGGDAPSPAACRKVNADNSKTTEVTSPESARETGLSAALRSICCRSSAPRARAGRSQQQSTTRTHPASSSLPSLQRRRRSLPPQPRFTQKASNICVAGAAETQVGADPQMKSKGKIKPCQRATFFSLFLQPWEKSIRCSESNSA